MFGLHVSHATFGYILQISAHIHNFSIFWTIREIPTKFHQTWKWKWQHLLQYVNFKNKDITCKKRFLLNFWSLSGAKLCTPCRSSKEKYLFRTRSLLQEFPTSIQLGQWLRCTLVARGYLGLFYCFLREGLHDLACLLACLCYFPKHFRAMNLARWY